MKLFVLQAVEENTKKLILFFVFLDVVAFQCKRVNGERKIKLITLRTSNVMRNIIFFTRNFCSGKKTTTYRSLDSEASVKSAPGA